MAEQGGLLAFVRSKIHSWEDSEDLVQEVFIQALSNLNVLEAVDNLTGWLYTVAKNKIIDRYRKKHLPTRPIEATDENGIRFSDILAAEIPDTLDEKTREFIYRAMTKAVEELPEKQQFVFIEQVIKGRTFRELAETSKEPLNTLIARKRYAVRFLRARLREIRELL